MAGIYIHIPFCRKACNYCDFHFSVNTAYQESMVDAITRELTIRKNELNTKIKTIYFGGGTPSILTEKQIQKIFNIINKNYECDDLVEVTIEANPDDLSKEKIQFYKNDTPINRFSIGTQSFHDKDLEWMNRSHNSKQAINSIEWVKKAGFYNITIDLIYGIPNQSFEYWKQNIQQAISLDIPHLSCYQLTVEPKTVLSKLVEQKKIKPVIDEEITNQFNYLIETLEQNSFEHYEISNFSKRGYQAKHNTSYWKGVEYIGIGPSAHSYIEGIRLWNISNNHSYIKSLKQEIVPQEKEILTEIDKYNEWVMTQLRLKKGLSIDDIPIQFKDYFLENIRPYINSKDVINDNNQFYISKKGKMITDYISSSVFYVE